MGEEDDDKDGDDMEDDDKDDRENRNKVPAPAPRIPPLLGGGSAPAPSPPAEDHKGRSQKGGRGVSDLGKIPTFSHFFLESVP